MAKFIIYEQTCTPFQELITYVCIFCIFLSDTANSLLFLTNFILCLDELYFT